MCACGQVSMSSALGRKRCEYDASKQWPVAMRMMDEVTRREWALTAPLMAATGLPLSGVWHARAAGWMMGTYSFLTFCHICSRGESGGGGSGWCGVAENWRFHSLRCMGLGLSLACV